MSQKAKKRAISPTREENYAEWFQECVKIAGLAEHSSVRGCMIFKPLACSLWDRMRDFLDREFKRRGVQNVYMPLFVPVKDLEKEAEHVAGFAKECAVVTHHRLIQKEGSLIPDPDSKLEELLVVRPTSELLFGEAMARWIHSYRDLPLLLNQWANVVRWEMRTRPFLRTTEFLWQEGHTAHATKEGANQNALEMLHVYKRFCHDILAIDVVPGQKSESEKFPGADITYTNEAIMQDKKALQACTSHDLGQNFAKACQIRFSTVEGGLEYAHTSSWGFTTRMIGALLMSHGDDDGAVYPPKIAPLHVCVVPFLMKEEDQPTILSYIASLKEKLSLLTYHGESIRFEVNVKDERASEKSWRYKKEGGCHILEIGLKEATQQTVTFIERDRLDEPKETKELEAYIKELASRLDNMQQRLFDKNRIFRQDATYYIQTKEELLERLERGDEGFFLFHYAADEASEALLKERFSVTTRCFPLEDNEELKPCIFTKKPSKKAIVAKSY